MLAMFSRAMKKIPFEMVAPFNENDLLLIMSPKVSFVLKNIMNDNEEYFSIKETMTRQAAENQTVFACNDFEASCSKFAEIMNTRIERFFDTKKSQYIFFDQEEQDFLRRVFKTNNLSCLVDIYMRQGNEKFEKVPFENMQMSTYREIRGFVNSLGVAYVLKPDRFINLSCGYQSRRNQPNGKQKSSFFNIKDIALKMEKERIGKIFNKYPDFKSDTKDGVRDGFKALSKKLHPDLNGGRDPGFIDMKESYEFLKKTSWYNKLPSKKEGSD